jgi:hypothetical protein
MGFVDALVDKYNNLSEKQRDTFNKAVALFLLFMIVVSFFGCSTGESSRATGHETIKPNKVIEFKYDEEAIMPITLAAGQKR